MLKKKKNSVTVNQTVKQLEIGSFLSICVKQIKYVTICLLFFFLYQLVYASYIGIKNPIPGPGDSYAYHIPISESILDGTFLHPQPPKSFPQRYYPGTTEAINSIFLALHIPLTLSNIFAICTLLYVLFALGKKYKFSDYYSLLFALSFCSLTVVMRWFNAISIDVWVAVLFTLVIIYLKKPKKSVTYVLLLGTAVGGLAGSKYPALGTILLLFIVYRKIILNKLHLKKVLLFLIPFGVLGGFWYLRNLIILGNPMYPMCIPFLPCEKIFTDYIFNISFQYPIDMAHAFFSEYKFWMFLPILFIYLWIRKRDIITDEIASLLLLGFGGLLLFLFYPTSHQPWIMVSSFRYSYPAFIPLILSIFLLAKKYKKEEVLAIFSFINILPVLSMEYHPKLLLIMIPLGLVIIFLIDKRELSAK